MSVHRSSRLRVRRWLGGLLAAALLTLAAGRARAQDPPDFLALIGAEGVMAHVHALAVEIGPRPMGSEAEARAAEYVAAALGSWGYAVEMQEFETLAPSGRGVVTSRNVIATRRGSDPTAPPVVLGAHLDSVPSGPGAGDNASGVAALLGAAEALRDFEPAHTLVFVAFGAEESGSPSGAQVFLDSLGGGAADVLAMINIDSVGVGAALYVYAGAEVAWPDGRNAAPEIAGGPVWVRDLALDLAAEMNIPLRTTPGETWDGFIGDWSDHYPFVKAGVPVAYFEAWLWEDAGDPWWGQETRDGDVMHTQRDVYRAVKPAQVEQAAELVAATAAAIASGAPGP